MLTSWKSVKRNGEIPLDQFADEVQYRRFLHWEMDLSGSLIAQNGTGDWHIQIVSEDFQTVLFEQKVSLTLRCTSYGVTGLEFFTWQFLKETIETPIIEGRPTGPDNPSWSHTIGGTEFSEFGTMELGGGTDYTNLTAIIEDWWDSPVYTFSLPAKCRLRVIKDTWNLGSSSRAEWQFRFRYGHPRMTDCKFAPFNELMVAAPLYSNSPTIMTGQARYRTIATDRRYYIDDEGTDPSLTVLPNGRRIMIVMHADGLYEYESFDSSYSWQKVRYPTKDPDVFEPQAIFPKGAKMPQVISYGDSRYILAVKGSDIGIREITDTGIGGLQVIGQVYGDESYAMDVDETGIITIVDNAGNTAYVSKDGDLFEKVVLGND